MRGKYTNRGLTGKLVVAVALVPTLAPIGSAVASAAPSAPPFEVDANATAPYGNVVFYDANGNQVTSGTGDLNNPFSYAVGVTAPDAGAIKANLAFAKPVAGTNPSLWTATAEAGPTNFSSATALPASTPADIKAYAPNYPIVATPGADIQTFIAANPTDPTAGYANTIEVRLTDSQQASGTYWESDIAYNTTSSPITVDGTTVPANGWAEVFPLITPSTTSLTTSAAGGNLATGSSITLTAAVPAGDAGTVQFYDGTTLLGDGPVSSGSATYSYAPAAGSHSYTATFVPTVGDETHPYTTSAAFVGGSTSGAVAVNVATPKIATSVSLTGPSAGTAYGSPATFTATVTEADAPTTSGLAGSVQFSDGGKALGSPVATTVGSSSSTASLTTSALPAGTDNVTATFTPTDTAYATSTSNSVSQVVSPATTATAVSSSPASGTVSGQAITLTANVSVTSGAGTPAGTVAFTDNGTSLPGCSGLTLSSGSASCTIKPLASASPLSIVATYTSSDGNFAGSHSSALSQTVAKAATTAAVTASQNPGFTGKSVTYTATVSVSSPGSGTPTGTVAFADGGVAISSCAAQAVTGSKANCTVTYSATGAHSITATYGGDANFSASPASSALTENIDQAVAPSAPTNLAAKAGDSKAALTWTAPTSAGTFPVSGYDVYVGTTAGGEATKPVNASPVTGTSYTVSGLTNDTKYYFTVVALSPAGSSPASNEASATPKRSAGYVLVGRDGGVFAFGVPFKGSLGGVKLAAPIVGAAETPDKGGYWIVARDGGVFAFGNAGYYGSLGGVHLAAPIATIVATPTGKGYWLIGTDGGVFSFGDARFFGSLGALHLDGPIVAAATTSDGKGYWMVGADGGIFSFGDAHFHGSLGGVHLDGLIVGIAPTGDNGGYTLVGADGGVFGFGDAHFYGSLGGIHLAQPIVSVVTTADGKGYTLVAADGGAFAFGDATFVGSLGGDGVTDIVAAG